MSDRVKKALLLVFLAAVAALIAYYLFHRLDTVRGYDDARDDQVSEAYAWIVGTLALLGCFNARVRAAAYGFMAGSMLFLGALSVFVLVCPLNPAMSFMLMLPWGAGGSVIGWWRDRNQS